MMIGYILGCISAVLYLLSRLPQIILNVSKKDAVHYSSLAYIHIGESYVNFVGGGTFLEQ